MTNFDRDGYLVVRGLLNPAQAQGYRSIAQRFSSDGDGADDAKSYRSFTDAVSATEELWPLIENAALVRTLREIVGDDLRYLFDSSIQVHKQKIGWHRDCASREGFGIGPDWDPRLGPYRVVKVAFYLESSRVNGSRLGVIPGSHKAELSLPHWSSALLGRAYNGLRPLLKSRQPIPPKWIRSDGRIGILPSPMPVWIATEPGDAIIFDQRLYHSASPIRGPKYAVMLGYGGDDQHSINHMCYFYYRRPDKQFPEWPDGLVRRLRDADLFIPRPRQEQEVLHHDRFVTA